MKKLLTWVGALLAISIMAETRIAMEPVWFAQPAMDSKTMPVDSAWSQKASNNYAGQKLANNQKWNTINSIWLKRTLEIPADWKGSRIFLDFQRINGNAIVFVNGQKAGERLGPYGEIEITKYAKPGDNELLVFNTRDYNGTSRTFETDYLRYYSRKDMPVSRWKLGIDATFFAVRRPMPVAMVDVMAVTSFREKKMTFKMNLDATAAGKYTLQAVIKDQDGNNALTMEQKNVSVKPGANEVAFSKDWKDPHCWELDGGYLYQAELKLLDQAGKVVDTDSVTFGFREVWTEGRDLILNGHTARFRVEWSSFGVNENSVSLLKLLGRNMIYFQSNPTGWWRDWAEVYVFDENTLNLTDREGIAVLLPVPPTNRTRDLLWTNEGYKSQYEDELSRFMKYYRNHPSILAWCVSMNSFNPRDAIHPDTLGKRRDYNHMQAKNLNYAMDQVRKNDSTRLAYTHADGNIGDLASGNCYPNFIQVQEAEDWVEEWARNGNMPWWACEFAAVYNGSYFKGKQMLITEYGAIYFGDESYDKETDKLLSITMEESLKNSGHGGRIPTIIKDAPIYWDIQRYYVEPVDRAWRTYGVLGWHYFNFSVGYGDPPEVKPGARPFGRYKVMTKPVSGRPEWANPQYDFHAKNMQSLLVYIGGYPHHTDKTHSFYGGGKITKNIVSVWDGPGDLKLNANWELLDGSSKAVASGKQDFELKNGDIKFNSFDIAAPEVKERTEYKIRLTVNGHGTAPVVDEFVVQVFPKAPKFAGKVRLYDPQGKSKWVAEQAQVSTFKPGDKLAPGEVLVIGRIALKEGEKMPFNYSDIAAGARVIVLEQMPQVWELLGFRNIEPGPRLVFPGSDTGTLMNGLKQEDLRYWSGSPDLLPEFKAARSSDVTIAPKASNRNMMASTVMEIPQAVGFEPLLSCEFDMNYTPLLRFSVGQGMVVFNSLDLTDRVGSDPAATLLAVNLLGYALNTKVEADKKVFDDKATFDELMKSPATSILLYRKYPADQVSKFVENGGTAIALGLDGQALKAAGIDSKEEKIYRAARPEGNLGKMLPRNLLRWRDVMNVQTVNGSPFYERQIGKGYEYFLQVTPEMLSERYKGDPNKEESVRLSVLRLKQMVSRVLTGSGAAPESAVLERVGKLYKGDSYKDIDMWTVFGPFKAKSEDTRKALDATYPGEQQAMSGDLNPNFTYKNDWGKTLDFRNSAAADSKGFTDMANALDAQQEASIAYAVKLIESDSDRKATIRFGVDYFAQIYVNGKLVYEVSKNHASPKPNQSRFRINLKKGENVITLKLLSGSKGFGFWINMSEGEVENTNQAAAAEVIYDPVLKTRSPYEYHYW